jgi:tetratricopeptide (TPR) repeat protein
MLIILICLGVIFLIVRKKIDKVKESKPVDFSKEKQAEVKKRLLETKLKKRLVEGSLKFFDFVKKTGGKIHTSLNEIKINILGRRAMWRNKNIEKKIVFLESEDNSLLAAKISAAERLITENKLDEAEEKFIDILSTDPQNIRAYMALGEIYTKLNDMETAEEAYRHIIKLDKTFLGGYKALMEIFQATKNWHKLIDLCQEVLVIDKNEVWVQVRLGVAYKKIGFPEKAEECFKAVVEKEPRNEELLDYLIDVAIINKNKTLSEKAWNTLKGVSSNTVKLQGYRNKIDLI